MERLLKRDELAELVGVPYNTLAVWRHKGYIMPPDYQGATARQSRYTVDEAFTVYCFVLSSKVEGLKMNEAATVSRYLQARPGTVEALYHYWSKPITIKLYPTHDLAAFNEPKLLFLDLTKRAYAEVVDVTNRLRDQGLYGDDFEEKFTEEVIGKTRLFSSMSLNEELDDFIVGTWEGIKDSRYARIGTSGTLAGRIFRNAKHVQYQNAPQRLYPRFSVDKLILSNMKIEELLTAEAWALEHIDDALFQFGLGGPPDSEGSPNYTVDVTEALERVVEAYGPPESEPRELLEEEEEITLE